MVRGDTNSSRHFTVCKHLISSGKVPTVPAWDDSHADVVK